jgi:hypothetical protein
MFTNTTFACTVARLRPATTVAHNDEARRPERPHRTGDMRSRGFGAALTAVSAETMRAHRFGEFAYPQAREPAPGRHARD